VDWVTPAGVRSPHHPPIDSKAKVIEIIQMISTFALTAFLVVFGIMNLFHTEIPTWVLGLLALGAGTAILFDRFNKKSAAV
jgi:hypothetical protein